jgi:hypothetical protein
MKYISFEVLLDAYKEGIDIYEVLACILLEDNIGIYDPANDKLVFKVFSFDDLIEFSEWFEEYIWTNGST